MAAVLVVLAAGFGAIVGSFLNVVIHRLPRGEPLGLFRKSRSLCPSCGARIRWFDNVPLASWIVLRGQCRACGWRIPVRYLLVEAVTAALFAVAAWRGHQLGWSPLADTLPAAVLTALLVAASAIALIHGRVPDRLLAVGAALGLAAAIGLAGFPRSGLGLDLRDNVSPTAEALLDAAAGALGAGLALFLLGVLYRGAFRRRVVGPGVAGLGGMAGIWLGPRFALAGLAAGLFAAAAGGLLLRALLRRRVATLAPFLTVGFWAALLAGATLARLFWDG